MQHLDEGTIHAWLDDQLPRDEAVVVEAHVAECRECADAVAEARGLIAASSRILTALDGVPRHVVPTTAGSQPSSAAPVVSHEPSPISVERATRRVRRRWFSAPSLAAAATIIVAAGTFTLMRANNDRRLMSGTSPVADERSASAADTQSAVMAAAPAAPGAPTARPAPVVSEPPAAANEARVERAEGGRRALADGIASRERDQAAQSPAGSARNAEPREPLQRARAEAQEELTKASAQVVATVAPPRPDTARVQIFRGAKAETARLSIDSVRADASAKVSGDLAATTGTVRGRVTDLNNTPLENVMVQVAGTTVGVATSRAGEFELRGVPAGQQQLIARRIGFVADTVGLTVAPSDAATADFRLAPMQVSLENVVVTAAGEERRRAPGAAAPARAASAQGAPATAYGCYDLGITPGTSQARSDFRQVPRRIALDSAVVPGRSDGVWYRVRDLAASGTAGGGIWRPTSADGIEVQWTYGTRTATVRLTGVPGTVLRGHAEEIDRAAALGASASVVAAKTRCPGD